MKIVIIEQGVLGSIPGSVRVIDMLENLSVVIWSQELCPVYDNICLCLRIYKASYIGTYLQKKVTTKKQKVFDIMYVIVFTAPSIALSRKLLFEGKSARWREQSPRSKHLMIFSMTSLY